MDTEQPEALRLADSMQRHVVQNGTYVKVAQMLRTQHAAIERKDALLRQALLFPRLGYEDKDMLLEAITKELQ